MIALNEQYLVDANGKRVGVVLDMDTYQQVLDALEELDDITAYDAAKASGETPIPLDQAIVQIERERASHNEA